MRHIMVKTGRWEISPYRPNPPNMIDSCNSITLADYKSPKEGSFLTKCLPSDSLFLSAFYRLTPRFSSTFFMNFS